jgi:hypothetical protein
MIVLCVAGRGRFHQPPSASNGLPPASITGAPHPPLIGRSQRPTAVSADRFPGRGRDNFNKRQPSRRPSLGSSLACFTEGRSPRAEPPKSTRPARDHAVETWTPAACRGEAAGPSPTNRSIVWTPRRGVALPGYVRNVSAVGGERDSAVGERYGGGDGSGCCLIERWCRPQACQDGAAGRPTERLGNGGDSVCSPLQPSLVAFQRRLQPRSAAP